jgi:hypothetical protein
LVSRALSSDTGSSATRRHGNILPLISFLRLICSRGEKLLPPAAAKAWRNEDSAAIDWIMTRGDSKKCASCKVNINGAEFSDSSVSELSCLHVICGECAISRDEDGSTLDESICPICSKESAYATSDRFTRLSSAVTDFPMTDYCPSAKVRALLRNLRIERQFENSDSKGKPVKRHEITL